MGMKLEAIREDRTRGGRSTYQCSYTLPPGLGGLVRGSADGVPTLLQEIMNVEHLWFNSKCFNTPASEPSNLPIEPFNNTTITKYEHDVQHYFGTHSLQHVFQDGRSKTVQVGQMV